MAKRAVRTFKSMLFKRIERTQTVLSRRVTGKTSDIIGWTQRVDSTLKRYTNTVHSATQMTPVEARERTYEIDVKINLEMRARRGRTYLELQVGDSVRVLKKRNI